MVRQSSSGHQLLLPPANCRPLFAVWTMQAKQAERLRRFMAGGGGGGGGGGGPRGEWVFERLQVPFAAFP